MADEPGLEVPDGQATGATQPPEQYMPCGQGTQMAVPLDDVRYDPASQLRRHPPSLSYTTAATEREAGEKAAAGELKAASALEAEWVMYAS